MEKKHVEMEVSVIASGNCSQIAMVLPILFGE